MFRTEAYRTHKLEISNSNGIAFLCYFCIRSYFALSKSYRIRCSLLMCHCRKQPDFIPVYWINMLPQDITIHLVCYISWMLGWMHRIVDSMELSCKAKTDWEWNGMEFTINERNYSNNLFAAVVHCIELKSAEKEIHLFDFCVMWFTKPLIDAHVEFVANNKRWSKSKRLSRKREKNIKKKKISKYVKFEAEKK